MARYLALEWDAREARVVVASSRGTGIVLEHAFQVELLPEAGEANQLDVGERIAAALAARGIKQSEALVAIGRANIELRNMNLPPAPPEEIPDLVRFQAMRQFTNIGEDWPLDYVELGREEDDETLPVLAASLSLETVDQIKQVCEAGNLSANRLLLRPFAAASLLRRFGSNDGKCELLVDLLADEADLTVVADGSVVVMRTVRLPTTDEPAVIARAVLGEIRRTIGAAQSQLRGRRIERIVICGDGAEHTALKTTVEEQLSLEVSIFDPFQAVDVKSRFEKPLQPGQYTPLIGVLADEAAGERHAIDFLNPRKRPEAPSNRGRQLVYGAFAAAVVLLLGGWYFLSLRNKDLEIADLRAEILSNQDLVERSQQKIEQADQIAIFPDTDIVWLDELAWLSDSLPDADSVILSEVYMGGQARRGALENGHLHVDGYVAESSVVAQLERKLQDDRHTPVGEGTHPVEKNPRYPWSIMGDIFITPEIEAANTLVASQDVDEEAAKAAESTDSADAVDDAKAAGEAEATENTEPTDKTAEEAERQASPEETKPASDSEDQQPPPDDDSGDEPSDRVAGVPATRVTETEVQP